MTLRTRLLVGTALLALGAGSIPGPVRAQDLLRAVQESYPTNLAMLTDAAETAVGEMLLALTLPDGATILVHADAEHEANWFVENLLVTRLTGMGHQVFVPEGTDPADAGDARGRGGKTAEPDTVAAEPAPDPGARAAYLFRFRVAECGLTYPDSFKKSPLGSRTVQRLASVSVFGTVTGRAEDDVVWVGRGDAERLDLVPAGKLSLLEGKNFPFNKPVLKTSGLGSYAEPALVTGIVAGLIYLFYTNQN